MKDEQTIAIIPRIFFLKQDDKPGYSSSNNSFANAERQVPSICAAPSYLQMHRLSQRAFLRAKSLFPILQTDTNAHAKYVSVITMILISQGGTPSRYRTARRDKVSASSIAYPGAVFFYPP